MSEYDAQHWQRIKTIVADALECSPEEQESFVLQACGDDADLKREVDRLLAQLSGTNSFLKPVTAQAMAQAVGRIDESAGLIGKHIGRYQIMCKIASGGMGTVYAAQQDKPRRTVALKVIQALPGGMTESVLRRFEFETQVLGRLRHPGIVQIYDAGTFDYGDGSRPFFAMELVEGQGILDFAADRCLTTDQRLRLMIKVCEAVQFAHQQGVIHRDLKPANILVVSNDLSKAEGQQSLGVAAQPKILDFGVARAINTDPQAATMHTQTGELIGSIRYMSPEQVSGPSDTIDTRSDIYALGVITYELLTGRLPYDLKSGTVAEVSRTIAEGEPLALRSVNRSFRGDLDTIVAKALERDRDRRYATAGEFAADLARFLNDEPILARPPTTLYQLRKFAARNRVLVGGVAATMLALTIGMVLYAIEARRANQQAMLAALAAQQASEQAQIAERESDRAQDEAGKSAAVNTFLNRMLAKIDPNEHGQDVNIAALVAETSAEIETIFADHPMNRAAVHDQVGTIYYNLGLYDDAATHYAAAYEIRREALGDDQLETLNSRNSLGLVALRQSRLVDAEQHFRAAYDSRKTQTPDDPQTLGILNNLAMLYQIKGDLDKSQEMLEETLAWQTRVLGEHHRDTLTTTTNLGSLHRFRNDLEAAERYHRAALDGFMLALGEDHATTLIAKSNLGVTLRRANKLDEAEELFRSAVDGLNRTLGPAHNDTLVASHNCGQLLLLRDKYADAEQFFRIAVDGFRASSGPQRDALYIALKNLGRSLQSQGKSMEAVEAYRESHEGFRSAYGDDDRRSLEMANLLNSIAVQSPSVAP